METDSRRTIARMNSTDYQDRRTEGGALDRTMGVMRPDNAEDRRGAATAAAAAAPVAEPVDA